MIKKNKIIFDAALKASLVCLLLTITHTFAVGKTSQMVLQPFFQQDSVYNSVDVSPLFPGGAAGWKKFIQGYRIPREAMEKGISGRIVVTFVVEKDGSLSDIKITRDLGSGTGEAVIALMKRSPKWEPGIQNGKIVRVAYVQTISVWTQKK